MKKLQEGINSATTMLSAALLGVVMVILAYNVFARFLGGGIQWYMEASQYLNIWAMLIAGVGICAKGEHLRIQALEGLLKGKAYKLNKLIISLSTIVFYLLFAYGSFLLASRSRQSISTMAPLKMAYVYWLMPAAAALSALSTALHAVIEQTETPEEGARKS